MNALDVLHRIQRVVDRLEKGRSLLGNFVAASVLTVRMACALEALRTPVLLWLDGLVLGRRPQVADCRDVLLYGLGWSGPRVCCNFLALAFRPSRAWRAAIGVSCRD